MKGRILIKRKKAVEPTKGKEFEVWEFTTPRGRVLLTTMRKSLEYYLRNTVPQKLDKLEEIPWSRIEM